MHPYAEEIARYAVALLACYGLFLRIGHGTGWSLAFLVLGLGAALTVILLDYQYPDPAPTVMGVLMYASTAFVGGVLLGQLLLWVA